MINLHWKSDFDLWLHNISSIQLLFSIIWQTAQKIILKSDEIWLNCSDLKFSGNSPFSGTFQQQMKSFQQSLQEVDHKETQVLSTMHILHTVKYKKKYVGFFFFSICFVLNVKLKKPLCFTCKLTVLFCKKSSSNVDIKQASESNSSHAWETLSKIA